MKLGQINFPDTLIEALNKDRLVIFAGAGVSMGKPAYLPSFWKLAQDLASGTGLKPGKKDPLDRFLGQLHHQGVTIHQRTVDILSSTLTPTILHTELLRLFGAPERVKIVTTNFDVLFEQAATNIWGQVPETFRAPALPLGRQFNGIVHVHGAVPHAGSLVLTDGDFGRAYLTEGWARRFLVDLFQHYAVLFVGYSHEDTVLQYLARALPSADAGTRFVLNNEQTDFQRWRLLGIDLVSYPKPSAHDYSCLNDGIRRLANFARRSVLDWQRTIKEIAEDDPPVDLELADTVRHALKDVVKTRFFVSAARKTAWVDWLDANEVLSPLFAPAPLDEIGELLARWLVEHFTVQHPASILLLIGKHHLHLNPALWWYLAHQIGLTDQEIPEEHFNRWITLLLHASPSSPDAHVLQWLAEKSAKQKADASVLQIFKCLSASRISIRKPFNWPSTPGTAVEAKPCIEQHLVGDHWNLNEIWQKLLKPRLDEMVVPVLALAISQLEERYTVFSQWENAGSFFDTDSYGRSAIEPHEQDQYTEALDVVIDAARDALEWMAEHRPSELRSWRDRLIASAPPLLRRLAVHAMRCDTQIQADGKIDWLMLNAWGDRNLRHEVFMLLKESYPSASADYRHTLVKAINGIEVSNDDAEHAEITLAFERLNWLHWLVEVDAGCTIAATAVDAIKDRFPDLKPQKHPDLTHWHSGARWVGPNSPWTVDQLLGRPPALWLDELITFKGQEFMGPDRPGLLHNVTEAIKQTASWGQELARALADAGHWEVDLWDALFTAWKEWPAEIQQAQQTIEWLEHPELYKAHARTIADLLYALVNNGGKDYANQLLGTSNNVACAIWAALDRGDDEKDAPEDWLGSAINRTSGILAEYWLNSLSITIKEGTSGKLPDDYRQVMEAMLQDDGMAGAYARTIFASQLAFLFTVDDEWTRNYLFPLLSDRKSDRFQQAWDGFLTSGRLTHQLVNELTPAFFKALRRLHVDLPSRRDRFIEYYVAALAWHVDDPLDKWIPKFFKVANAEEQQVFARELERMLRGMDAERQRAWWSTWLSKYWHNRLNGSPLPLQPGEVEEMLNWVAHLDAVFPEAVAVAVRMPPSRLEHSHLLYELKESDLIDRYPDAIARLLIFLLDCAAPRYLFYGVEEILSKLSHHSLDITVKASLDERLAAAGIDPSRAS